MHNKALHWTAIPLRSIATSELGRSTKAKKTCFPDLVMYVVKTLHYYYF